MIFPVDYRERLIKQQKSRQYKAMLDDQIREKDIFNRQNRTNRRVQRIKTQPQHSYGYTDKIPYSYQRELPHQSTFLPSIHTGNGLSSGNIYDSPQYNYRSNNQNQRIKKTVDLNNFGKYNTRHVNDESDGQLQKCLKQCDDLIYGINKKFINIQSHIRGKRSPNLKNSRTRPYSQFQIDSNQYQNGRKQPRYRSRLSQSHKFTDDVGRNQMMNYNLTNAKQKQILHISMPYSSESRDAKSLSAKQKGSHSLNKNGQKTKRKNVNPFDINESNTPNRKNKKNNLDYDDQQNQFVQSMDLNKSVKSNPDDSVIGPNGEKMSKTQLKKLQAHSNMLKKDSNIIQNLKKAKNRGSILFKKIQMFKKQRQDLNSENIDQKNQSFTSQRRQKMVQRNSKSQNSTTQQKQLKNISTMTQNNDKQLKKQDITLLNNNNVNTSAQK